VLAWERTTASAWERTTASASGRTRASASGSTRASASRRILALAFVAALLATGCASVERSVQAKRVESHPDGKPQPVVVWDSNLYPEYKANVDQECYDRAQVGAPVPEGCVKPLHVILEANPYRSASGLSFLASLLVMGALTAFTMRWIGWRPRVRTDQAEQTALAQQHAASPAGVRLMHAVSGEKRARSTATARGRDLRRPAPTGALFGVALLIPAVLLFGYGAALAWAVVTAVLTFLALGLAELLLLLPGPPEVADPHVPISRMLFLAGVCAAFLAVTLFAALIPTPLLDLHGLAWLHQGG
jgi:hypothetical protein